MLDEITFDKLPQAVANILDGIAEIKTLCEDIRGKDDGKDIFLSIEELCAYHPNHPSPTTVRRWKRLGLIPYYKDKVTRRIQFKKSDIDNWIASSRHLTREEKNALYDSDILSKRRHRMIGGFDDDE